MIPVKISSLLYHIKNWGMQKKNISDLEEKILLLKRQQLDEVPEVCSVNIRPQSTALHEIP